jgi:TPR repeat protein
MMGDAESMNAIAIKYASGEGVSKDCRLAKQWLEKAVIAGSWTAPINIQYWGCS